MLAHRHLEHCRQMALNRAQRRQRQTFSLSEIQAAAATTKSGEEGQEEEVAEAAAVDDWCDNQQALNHAVARILQHPKSGEHGKEEPQQQQAHEQEQQQQQPQHQIKVIQTFRNALFLNPLWQALVGCTNISSLSLVGVQLDARAASRLGHALSRPDTKLQHLQLCRLLPDGIVALSEALPYNCHLTHLRLTFNHDVSPSLASTLLQAIAQHGRSNSSRDYDDDNTAATTAAAAKKRGGKGIGLTSLKLYGLDLSPVMADVALVVRACQASLTELRLTRCHLKNNMNNMHCLTTAIQETNCLRVLDLSMNEISFSHDNNGDDTCSCIAKLVQTPSIQDLVLSQNELGKMTAWPRTTNTSSNTTVNHHHHHVNNNNDNHNDARAFCRALGRNTTLTSLSLDMNPLSLEFATLLEHVSLAQNTTLTRLGILTASLSSPYHSTTTGTSSNTNNNNGSIDANKSCSSPDVRQRLRHAIQLNQAGRGWIRNSTMTITTMTRQQNQQQQQQQYDDCSKHDDHVDSSKLFSRVRYSHQPEILYSLLQERPDFWIIAPK